MIDSIYINYVLYKEMNGGHLDRLMSKGGYISCNGKLLYSTTNVIYLVYLYQTRKSFLFILFSKNKIYNQFQKGGEHTRGTVKLIGRK